ncbi:hypothetical protein J5N97_025763 [Dioscorea zingiberensis]|uniref:Hyaluronan/mRNA-binding protein domain-containing protein n=1 Tax=Dioscorea zingiberensis TaxID=325984 RepID=A0A9D5C170_9LILI|nr:hypothetical protein J5N97_025763 [Dioscorea zingiberensis]
MATANPFYLLGDDDNDDPSQLIATQQLKVAAKKNTNAAAPPPAAKLPSKPAPPAQAVRDARSGSAPVRDGAGRGWPSNGRGGRGGRVGTGVEDGDTAKPFERERNFNKERGGHGGRQESFRGSLRGGYGNGEAGGDSDHPPRRTYERRSGTGRGHEMKREGAGRGNWGTATDGGVGQETEDNVNIEGNVVTKKQSEQEDAAMNKENKEKEEDKEMTLDEYEKIRNEKRKALLAMKTESRKVDFDKEFESMQQLSIKKGNDDIFLKLGTDKDVNRKKENADQEERSRRVVSINEFLKPVEGERFYSPGGQGRGRERGDHGTARGGFGGGVASSLVAPSFEDPSQFPTLGGK